MFSRDKYLNQLIEKENNHLIKLITGIRRSGKSFLLNEIFYNYLLAKKIKKSQIIKFAFDSEEDISLLDKYLPEQETAYFRPNDKQKVVNNRKFMLFIQEKTRVEQPYYLLLDEIQNLDDFVRVLNGFLRHQNFDIYVTGSNSNLLSSQVDTEFNDRCSRIHLLPLSFIEYLSGVKTDKRDAFDEYIRYGGIPIVQLEKSDESKSEHARSIYLETYLKDVKDRHPQVNVSDMDATLKTIASMISTPINPTKIENTFKSTLKESLSNGVIDNYITWFEEAYLLNKVFRYNIRGRNYIGTPYKIYFEDIGIRNAILNFRDVDETDLIENMVFNELRYRGFNVDVGEVIIKAKTDRVDVNGKPIYADKRTEVDFVANKGNKTYYVQVALKIDNEQKENQEYESIRNIPDSFKKVVIVKEQGKPYYTKEGFLRINLLDFLTNMDSLDL
jgi:predicted AAA+ superfamily ATPase